MQTVFYVPARPVHVGIPNRVSTLCWHRYIFKLSAACLSFVPAVPSHHRTVQPCSSISRAHATGSAWAQRAKVMTASLWATHPTLGPITVTRSSVWHRGWRRCLRKAKMYSEQLGVRDRYWWWQVWLSLNFKKSSPPRGRKALLNLR